MSRPSSLPPSHLLGNKLFCVFVEQQQFNYPLRDRHSVLGVVLTYYIDWFYIRAINGNYRGVYVYRLELSEF